MSVNKPLNINMYGQSPSCVFIIDFLLSSESSWLRCFKLMCLNTLYKGLQLDMGATGPSQESLIYKYEIKHGL